MKALTESNRTGDCNINFLYRSMRNNLGGEYWGNLENLIEKDEKIDRRSINRKNSIYGGLSFFQSFPLYLVKLGSIVKINEHIVGTDKFGHFFEEGFISFQRAFQNGEGIENGLSYGEETELGIYGLKTTGIYSYGDLVANFHGMRFWKLLLGLPMVACNENKWVVMKPFDWNDFIDSGRDEGINCNRYYNDKFEMSIFTNILELEKKFSKRYQCPVESFKCRELSNNYRDQFGDELSKRLIHPLCLY